MDLNSQANDVITKMHGEAKCEPWAEDQRSFELKREGASVFFLKPGNNGTFTALLEARCLSKKMKVRLRYVKSFFC